MHHVKAGHDDVLCRSSSGEVETGESKEVSSLAKYARYMFGERPCILVKVKIFNVDLS